MGRITSIRNPLGQLTTQFGYYMPDFSDFLSTSDPNYLVLHPLDQLLIILQLNHSTMVVDLKGRK